MQKLPSSDEHTPQPRPPRGHVPSLAFIVVTFIPVMFVLLQNFFITAQARTVFPAFIPAEPIISIPSSLSISFLNISGDDIGF